MYITSVLGIVASIYTLLPLFNNTFIKDGVLLEIKTHERSMMNDESLDVKVFTDSGEDASKLTKLTLTFWNKGDEVLKESSFSKSNPFRINLNKNILIKDKINFIQENSLINEGQISYDKTQNTINFSPFILESDKKFSISFTTFKKENYEIKINGQIENIPLSFGYKEKKLTKFLSKPFIAIFVLIIIVSIPLAFTLYLSDLLSKHFLQSKIFYIIRKRNETNSKNLKSYIEDVLKGHYSMRIFATEYIDFLIDNKINFYTKDLTNIFITHKYLFDNVSVLSMEYSNFYDIAYNREIFHPNKTENTLDKSVDIFLNEVCNLSIIDKIKNLLFYFSKYLTISDEDKELLIKSKVSFLGIKEWN